MANYNSTEERPAAAKSPGGLAVPAKARGVVITAEQAAALPAEGLNELAASGKGKELSDDDLSVVAGGLPKPYDKRK